MNFSKKIEYKFSFNKYGIISFGNNSTKFFNKFAFPSISSSFISELSFLFLNDESNKFITFNNLFLFLYSGILSEFKLVNLLIKFDNNSK